MPDLQNVLDRLWLQAAFCMNPVVAELCRDAKTLIEQQEETIRRLQNGEEQEMDA